MLFWLIILLSGPDIERQHFVHFTWGHQCSLSSHCLHSCLASRHTVPQQHCPGQRYETASGHHIAYCTRLLAATSILTCYRVDHSSSLRSLQRFCLAWLLDPLFLLVIIHVNYHQHLDFHHLLQTSHTTSSTSLAYLVPFLTDLPSLF